jgi:hypothetical protein
MLRAGSAGDSRGGCLHMISCRVSRVILRLILGGGSIRLKKRSGNQLETKIEGNDHAMDRTCF